MAIREINTPLYQRVGAELIRVNLETTAAQVRTADGGTVESKLASLSSAVAGQTTVSVVEDIAARDALTGMKAGDQCWVKDASADPTVTAGAAKYLYESADVGWVKTAEAESMDVTVSWTDIAGRPDVAAADVADAVSKRHAHANKTDVLDKLTADGSGNLLFDGRRIDDGRVEVATSSGVEGVPANLRDGGLLIIDAGAAGEEEQA